MADKSPGPAEPITAPLSALEPNVIIAGLEGAVVIYGAKAAFTGSGDLPGLSGTWHWSYAVVGVLVLVGIIVLGLFIEGLASFAEYAAARKMRSGDLREWYTRLTDPPSDWKPGQRWIWKSPEANREFATRRVRMMVARNTAFLILILTLLLIPAHLRNHREDWVAWILTDLAAGGFAFLVFFWIWVRAHYGWNKAVRDAAELGDP